MTTTACIHEVRKGLQQLDITESQMLERNIFRIQLEGVPANGRQKLTSGRTEETPGKRRE